MNVWPQAIGFVLRWETGGDPDGGLTRDPADPGGTTRWGISQRAHPELEVEQLTREQAQAVYWSDYWQPLQCGALPAPVGFALFDWAVHSGRVFAAKRLQRILRVWVDGHIGRVTIDAAQARDALELAVELTIARARNQGALVQANLTLGRFLGGWGARLVDLTATVCRL